MPLFRKLENKFAGTSAVLLVMGIVFGFAVDSSRLGAQQPKVFRFDDKLNDSGILFQHADGSGGQRFLVEAIASGLATFDYDLDGDIDIYFLSGSALRGTEYASPPKNRLYRNDGGWKFTDVTDESGLGDQGFGLGVAVGDINNDGWPDVYLNNFGANALYCNNGDGSFTPAESSVVSCGNKVGAGVSMLDMDADGDLDIYVANYIQFTYDMRPPTVFQNRIVYGGPLLYPGEPDDLLRNNGDGTYSNVSVESGIAAEALTGMGSISFDADQDGDVDVFVANDSARNLLWINDGRGKFVDRALIYGVAYDHKGEAQGSMGVDAGDFNGDGLVDLFQTAYEKQLAALYENQGNGLFLDATLRSGAGSNTYHHVNWGTAFFDADNDGDQDLFMANGHIYDNLDEFRNSTAYKIPNQFYENRGRGKFVDVSHQCGAGLEITESSRGVVADDLDRDGRIDLVILNSRTQPTLLKNESTFGHWLEVDLVGVQCNRSSVGSKVWLTSGGREQVREVHSGRGYQSHFGSRLHFGVAQANQINQLRVQWPDGTEDQFTDIEIDGLYLIRQGHSISRRER